MRSLPAPSARTQRWSMAGLQTGIALMAIVSLLPYFLWSHQKPAYAIATLIVIASCAGCFPALTFSRERVLLSIAEADKRLAERAALREPRPLIENASFGPEIFAGDR